MKKPKCEACRDVGWLLMAGGWGILGTKAEFAEILRRLKKDPDSVALEVQRCDMCEEFESDDAAKEKASLLIEVDLTVMFSINGHVTGKTLAKALVENAIAYIEAATSNDTEYEDIITRAKVIELQTERVVSR
jgi:hypothetical protein